MNRLLIIGAGGFGREVLAWAEDIVRATPTPDWTIGGFLDGNPQALAKFDIAKPIVGNPADYQPQPTDRFICAIGDTATKLRVCYSLQERGAQFINLIHPTALVGPRCQLGVGVILCPFAALTVDVTLGNFVTLNLRASIGHDVVVGDGCLLNSFCDVTGAARLGEGVFMGSHAVVAPKTVVEDFARIGAGSVVVRRVKAGSSVIGVPAKRIDFGLAAENEPAAKAA
jgi:sugar O-acyltransferase (sialic acid O-acetyltransferase NeuD family)